MLRKLLSYIREHALIRPGDRLGVAVSGGADSVALLRALLEARAELGIVLFVVHLHHGIRGTHADLDAQFVEGLAAAHGLDLHLKREDAPAYARERRLGLEAAGRELRYRYFNGLVAAGTLDKVATAHTFDDQAETVLLRLIRGAGLQGLAGIQPRLTVPSGQKQGIIRPLLSATRSDVLSYLGSIGQTWREDHTNADTTLTRNRIRHQLLPLLERDYNPSIRQSLVNLAEIARADNDFLEVAGYQAFESLHDSADLSLNRAALAALPIALQRRILMVAAEIFLGMRLGFREVEELSSLLGGDLRGVELERGVRAKLIRSVSGDRLQFLTSPSEVPLNHAFELALSVPGEIVLAEHRFKLRTTLVTLSGSEERYNPAALLDPVRLASTLTLRNWRPGDRFHPLHSKSPEKLKRLFQERKISQALRSSWPVLLSGEDIVWVRGFPVSAKFAIGPDAVSAVFVEDVPL